jgi:hypothetical protein
MSCCKRGHGSKWREERRLSVGSTVYPVHSLTDFLEKKLSCKISTIFLRFPYMIFKLRYKKVLNLAKNCSRGK